MNENLRSRRPFDVISLLISYFFYFIFFFFLMQMIKQLFGVQVVTVNLSVGIPKFVKRSNHSI